MKKSLASILATAIVVGATSSALAAANPFSDVPAGHWAYDAVAQLARDGVINGYGDGTYRGDRNITRYEMAQMIAKAMAKNPKGVDKALLDKLIAEFRDELDNLGVRVAKLEKHADVVKWEGELRYRYWSNRSDSRYTRGKENVNHLLFRLDPTAEVNDHWNVKARLDAETDLKTDDGWDHDNGVSLKRAYAEGTYTNFNIQLGKIPFYSFADDGLVMDSELSGARAEFGKDLKLAVQGGRWKVEDHDGIVQTAAEDSGDTTASYWGAEILYNKDKIDGGVGYHHFNSNAFSVGKTNSTENKASIWSLGARYQFDKNIGLHGAYARNQKADKERDAYNIQLNYKGIETENKGTWGTHVAYRKLGRLVALSPQFDTAEFVTGVKGWELGLDYVPFKNVEASVIYFHGKDIEKVPGYDDAAKVLFGRVSFFF
ncbi:MAG: putative porin [Selenomonadaceae bacterium]|nr:putative porin [Selenomonadaceae bacterium]